MNSFVAPLAGLIIAVCSPRGGSLPPAHACSQAHAPMDGRASAGGGAPKVESFAVRGSSIERVRVTVAVDAPIDRVRAVLFDFARYPEFMAGYKKARVLRTTPDGGRSVHLEIEQAGGMVKLWMRVDISPPRSSGATESYEGRLADGNVKAFRTRWELAPLDGDRTRLTIESFLDPDLPLLPASFVNQGARDGLRDAILALKARTEGRRAAGR